MNRLLICPRCLASIEERIEGRLSGKTCRYCGQAALMPMPPDEDGVIRKPESQPQHQRRSRFKSRNVRFYSGPRS